MCFPAGDRATGNQAELLRTLQAQGVEISRATAPFTIELKTKKKSEPGASTGVSCPRQPGWEWW